MLLKKCGKYVDFTVKYHNIKRICLKSLVTYYDQEQIIMSILNK